jgi:hypothetical protein
LVAEFTAVVDSGGDVVTLRVAPPDSEVEPGEYRWDLERDGNGIVQTVLAGRVSVKGDITRV